MSKERFIRWQGNTIAQLSAALSLLSGLAVAGLGFSFSLLRDERFKPSPCFAVLFLLGLLAFFVASIAGVGAVITRLLDFRLTAQKVRGGSVDEPLTFFGTTASGYGKLTWILFWLLTVSFAIAICCTSVVVARVYLVGLLRTAA